VAGRLLDLGQLARPLPADEDEEEALIQGPNCDSPSLPRNSPRSWSSGPQAALGESSSASSSCVATLCG